ncbi:hypothetical protein CROQUDRAFT_664726 [Cronartium quercuum f. sp. fusiforme G11]|uniref:AMMECR1 domain-containing protein n=1 Tax=Cronartium quercuum f. sp. fusiforme G11 TaxID=708437 RepID=A0A9P6NB38_9BASI|nr:hypothetical protein CROQUDRAFT_664726 [Cronartium quercuum f. sp. fusiforme G11]
MSLFNFNTWQAEQTTTASTEPAQNQHCFYCFDELYAELHRREGWRRTSEELSQQIVGELAKFIGSDEFPLFVTWNVVRNGHHPRLRGCIGNFSPSPVRDGLKDYALISALKDHRFPPITLYELEKLSCSVSLLHSFEDCKGVLDWSIGKHGIYLHFPDPSYYPLPIESSSNSESVTPREESEEPSRKSGTLEHVLDTVETTVSETATIRNSPRASLGKKTIRMLSATYLPDVAAEQGWTKLDTINSAIQKAGWSGPITQALHNTLIIERYQSSKCTATYQEWAQWRARMGCPV